jgi:hypothetical protein
MKPLKKKTKKLIYVLDGNIDRNVLAASGAPISVKLKWRLKYKRHNTTSRTHCLAPWITGAHSMRFLLTYEDMCEGPGIQTSDATVPERVNFTGRSQRRWVTVAGYVGKFRISRWRLQGTEWSTYRVSLDQLYEFLCCFRFVSCLYL